MKIIITESFRERLEKQVAFIATDSPSRSRKFKNDLINAIRKILPKPLKHRQSIYFDDPYIRDLIFKGYTVVLPYCNRSAVDRDSAFLSPTAFALTFSCPDFHQDRRLRMLVCWLFLLVNCNPTPYPYP